MKKLLLSFILTALVLAAQTTHTATLTWNDTTNPSGTTYNIYRASGLCSGNPSYTKIATSITAKTYVDSTVTPGNYCYYATATFGGVESGPSNTALAPIPSFAPTNLTVTVQ